MESLKADESIAEQGMNSENLPEKVGGFSAIVSQDSCSNEKTEKPELPVTTLYTHEACTKHFMGHNHPESPDRVKAILTALKAHFGERQQLKWQKAEAASTEDLKRYHSEAHVRGLLSKFKRSEEKAIKAGITDFRDGEIGDGKNNKQVHRRLLNTTVDRIIVDEDTSIMRFTKQAALVAAGAVVQAVDDVMHGHTKNAFCVVRPPVFTHAGHHAERNKAMGFCFFNNAAIGAAHVVHDYPEIEKVAVIDFDVHHGNGTQEGFQEYQNYFYGSTHEGLDNPDFFPGTGRENETGVCNNIVNRPLRAGAGSSEFRSKFSEIMEALDKFAPGFIIISAGFDAAIEDPLADIELKDEDFHWATKEILKVAEKRCQSRVVSVLEGGYNLKAISRASVAHVKALLEASVQEEVDELSGKLLETKLAGNISATVSPPLRIAAVAMGRSKSKGKGGPKPIVLKERSVDELLRLGQQRLRLKATTVKTSKGVTITNKLLQTLPNDTVVLFS